MMTTTVMGIAVQSRRRDNKQHVRGYLANIEVSKRAVIDIYMGNVTKRFHRRIVMRNRVERELRDENTSDESEVNLL